MSANGANGVPRPFQSREWSCDTLARGMSQVFQDVKTEPWQDIPDEALQERLKAPSFQTVFCVTLQIQSLSLSDSFFNT